VSKHKHKVEPRAVAVPLTKVQIVAVINLIAESLENDTPEFGSEDYEPTCEALRVLRSAL
jgi:hypothetical protein